MKKILVTSVLFAIILMGCSKSIKPIKVIKTDFDLLEAEVIMKRAWKPVNEMTNANLETKPDIQISSKEEFFDIYDFSYMSDSMGLSIFETIVDMGDNNEVIKDDNGNLVFGEGCIIYYIPTIYDEGVFIKKAYIRDSRYKEKYNCLNIVELVIEEDSNNEIGGRASGFYRRNIFRENENNEWILYSTEGTTAIGWDR